MASHAQVTSPAGVVEEVDLDTVTAGIRSYWTRKGYKVVESKPKTGKADPA